AWLTLTDLFIHSADFASVVALGSKAPAVGLGDLVAVLVVELDVVNLLDGPACKARLVRNQGLKRGFRRDFIVASHRFMPGPVCAGPHGVYAGQAANVARNDAVRGEQETGQCNNAAVFRLGRVLGIAP